jgi:hypothetical protein
LRAASASWPWNESGREILRGRRPEPREDKLAFCKEKAEAGPPKKNKYPWTSLMTPEELTEARREWREIEVEESLASSVRIHQAINFVLIVLVIVLLIK